MNDNHDSTGQNASPQDLTPSHANTASETSTQITAKNPSSEREVPAMARMRMETEEFVDMVHQLDAATTALIPEGVHFRGTIDTQGRAAVIVKGTHEGVINAGEMPVFVAAGAKVTGLIQSSSDVFIAGHVEATKNNEEEVCIRTEKRFLLAGTGVVEGDVVYGAVRIYDGVISGRLLPAVARTY